MVPIHHYTFKSYTTRRVYTIFPKRQVSLYYHTKPILSLATFPALGNSSESSRTLLPSSLILGFPSSIPVLRWLSSNLYLVPRQHSACAPFRSLVVSGAGSSAVVRRRISREQIREEIPAKNQERTKKSYIKVHPPYDLYNARRSYSSDCHEPAGSLVGTALAVPKVIKTRGLHSVLPIGCCQSSSRIPALPVASSS